MIKYQFYLSTGYRPTLAHPIYGDNLTMDYEHEQGQKFFRKKLNGKLTFVGNDFDFIMNDEIDFDTRFILSMQISYDNGQTWDFYWYGYFTRTDCEINYDDKVILVQPTAEDDYTEILNGLEKEYNLIELNPTIERLNFYKRALLQIYIPKDKIVSCFINGTYWEQDAEVIDEHSELTDAYKFGYCSSVREISVSPVNPSYASVVKGIYRGKINRGGNRQEFDFNLTKEGNNDFYIYMHRYKIPDGRYSTLVQIKRTSTDGVMYEYSEVSNRQYFDDIEIAFHAYSSTYGAVQGTQKVYDIYSRFICDVESVGGVATYPIPENDIIPYNRNYTRVLPYSSYEIGEVSMEISNEPTQWGRRDDGKYFAPPYSLQNAKYYPIGRTTWLNASVWFAFSLQIINIEESSRSDITLRYAYPLSSVISVLLAQIAPSLSHEPTAEYSQILYGQNPLVGETKTLMISPKSNVLNGEFQVPAQKAPITLQQVLTMLRNMYQLYWFIDNGKLRIEHIRYFKNGGSYTNAPSIGYDLTTLLHPRNEKPWGFAVNTIRFDKDNIAERYEYSWGDDVTELFTGEPIDILSNFAQTGNIENVNIGGYNPDVDIMLLNPTNMSQDGFALFGAVRTGDVYTLPLVPITYQGFIFQVQNGYLAMRRIQPNYLLWDMPAYNVRVNGNDTTAFGIKRLKKQEVTIPIEDDEPNLVGLVKTNIGEGTIEKISLNLNDRTIKTSVEYDTY